MNRSNALLTILAIGLVSGCGGASKTFTDNEGNTAKISTDGNSGEVTIEGPDGGKVRIKTGAAGSASLPEGFPDDVPTFPGATIQASVSSPGGMNVVLQTGTPLEDVVNFYEQNLKKNGWTVRNNFKTPAAVMLSAAKEKRTQMVSISTANNGTVISITLPKAK